MIKKLLLYSLATITLSVFATSTVAPSVSAATVDLVPNNVCRGKAANSAVCQDSKNPNQNPLTGNNGAILKVTRIIAVIAGFVAVLIIVLSGIRMITAAGDSNEVAGARRAIIYALIGIVFILFAQAIVGLVVSKI